jgi:uncharacterized protein (TIGR00255 family)
MARSMTGYGKAAFKNDHFEIIVEARNLNNRYIDINLRMPKFILPYEFKIKELIKSDVIRGKITVNISFKDLSGEVSGLSIREESVKEYFRFLEQIKSRTGIDDQITLDHLLAFKDLWEPDEPEYEDEEVEKQLLAVVKEALGNMNDMREKEFINIQPDILNRLDFIEKGLTDIKKTSSVNARRELEKLYQRIIDLIGSGEVDKDRLELELAMIADRVDVTEECIRLKSHLDMFRDVLANKSEVGKSLTFILQEMQREVNTIGSKTTEITVSHKVISIKEEIEKIREQAQNLE